MLRKTWLEINLDNLEHNCRYFIEHTQKKLIAVIKANGYGCCDEEVAKVALQAGASMLAVSSLDEAMALRNAGIKAEILILGYVEPRDAKILIKNDLATSVVSLQWVLEVIKYDISDLKIHLKVDTGMNRIGIKDIEQLKKAYTLLQQADAKVEGIFTHYACSDEDPKVKTDAQFTAFKKAYEALDGDFKYIHCDNSDAAIDYAEDLTNTIRVGIGLFGYCTNPTNLKSVVSLYTTIVNVKTVAPEETIGYGATYKCEKPEIIATLPIGYADGFIRRNSGRQVYVDGEFATIVGRVCMDQCMIKLSRNLPVGTVVELIGEHISIQQMARELDTIVHEIMTNFNERLTRRYIKDHQEYLIINKRVF
ncbi:MAG: alanine racemase [Erysipelotrichaceae bacterium]|nr:alanine racemase [Erysipelotrichaceae bacterium]MDY5252598.1 alanine racemase [Erysipelotrichaceae bacterium]